MLSERDLDRLKARTEALRQAVVPPELQLWVRSEGDEPPNPDKWRIDLVIENQRELP